MPDGLKRVELCKTGDVAPGNVIQVAVGDLEVAVYNADGVIFVTDDACTHGPGSMSEGCLDGHIIECDFHQGKFDIRTGKVTAPPCTDPIKTYAVTIEDDTVCIFV